MVILWEITLKNFKSFKGEHKIDGLMAFSAVVGPNGSGKSNFTDAICFVMGIKPGNLRVTRVDELVHRSISAESKDVSVKAVLRKDDGTEVQFERSLVGSASRYRINDYTVSYEGYVEGLTRLHVNPRVKNFVVFQDSVDSILEKSPKERAAMFEEISGSGLLASDYKRLSTSISKYKQELEYHLKNRKIIMTEINAMQVSNVNAKEYRSLEKKHATEQIILTLFDLRCLKHFFETSTTEVERMSKEIEELTTKKFELEETLASTLQRYKQEKHEIEALERQAKAMELRSIEVSGEVRKLEAAIEYAESRVDFCRESYNSALNADEARKRAIAELEEALDDVEKKKGRYCLRYSETLGINLELRPSQETEYEKLKNLFLKICAKDNERLLTLEQNYDSLKDKFSSDRQKRNETKDAIERQVSFRLATKERGNELEQRHDEAQRKLEDERKLGRDLNLKFQVLKEQEQNLMKQIEKMSTVHLDGHEVREMIKKTDIVESLRQRFPGVYDRLGNACKPIHERYNIAMIKVFGPHMNSIVVDTMVTATVCANYLRAQSLGVETFLPLDGLKVKPLKEHLRFVKDPPNVKLLYDVIDFAPATISKAVLYATGSTLVSETAEDATRIALNTDKNKRYNQDGIYYRKSGLITGGTLDLAMRVQRYNSEEQATLQMRKERTMSALRAIRHNMPSERELSDVSVEIQRLAARAKWIDDAYTNARRELFEDEMKTLALEDIFDDTKSRLSGSSQALKAASEQIKALKSNIQAEEDRIFAYFCKSIGVADIRQYENGYVEFEKNLQGLDNQIDHIKKQLEFEMCRKTTSKVELWKKKLNGAEAKLRSAREKKETYTRGPEYEDIMKKIHYFEPTFENLGRMVGNTKNEITRLRALLCDVSQESQAGTTKLNGLKISIQRSKQKRHAILTDARINGLKIPMVNDPGPRSSQIETSDSGDSSTNAATVEESPDTYEDDNVEFDFTKLPRALLELQRSEAVGARKELASRVVEISSAMERMEDPNMKASQQLTMLKEKKEEIDKKIRETSVMLHKITADFEKIKAERYARFMEVFENVEGRVDAIYKRLTGSKSAQAYLMPENPEEPYLGNVYYDCIAPGKRFYGIKDLSGGEKVLASLSLLFAVQSSDSPPFQILDEIDAALDKKNVKKVSKYITSSKESQQSIVISHNPELYVAADLLIGIVPKVTANGVDSKKFTLNLRPYRDR